MEHGVMRVDMEKVQSYDVPLWMKKGCYGLMILGSVVFLLGLLLDAQRLWISMLHHHFYFMSLSLGGLFFSVLQWISVARWSAPMRRMAEAIASTFPLVLLSFLLLMGGVKKLYVWMEPFHVHGDVILEGKSGYLNMPFFVWRNLLVLLVFIGFGRFFLSNSLLQDKNPQQSTALFLRNKSFCPLFLIFFALFYTMQAFDQIMSLEPKWFSTIFGVYCFSGFFILPLP